MEQEKVFTQKPGQECSQSTSHRSQQKEAAVPIEGAVGTQTQSIHEAGYWRITETMGYRQVPPQARARAT